MKTTRTLLLLGFFAMGLGLVFAPQASAQDGCCIAKKTSGNDAETAAFIEDKMLCQAGKTVDRGFTPCSWRPDPENLCAQNGPKERCGTCGFHWNGGECFVQDPVELAKKKLEEEQAAKEAAKAEEEKAAKKK